MTTINKCSCGEQPELTSHYGTKPYPGSLAVKCNVCGKTSMGAYNTNGNTANDAISLWNSGRFYEYDK